MFKGSSKLGFWGGVATIVYFLAITYLIFCTDYVEPNTLTLNELGDFFAGVFGPPALIWVVISFYLQSDELKNSVEALNLQAEELKKSVEQQIAMVGITEQALQHDIEAKKEETKAILAKELPLFEFIRSAQPSYPAKDTTIYKYHIMSRGQPAYTTFLDVDSPNFSIDNHSLGFLEQDSGLWLNIRSKSKNTDDSITKLEKGSRLTIITSNLAGKKRTQVFEVFDDNLKQISCDP